MQRIRDNIFIESNFFGVTVGAIVTPKGILCVDTPTSPVDTRKWRLQLAQLEAGSIRYVINTDHNRDRIMGNQWCEAPVIAHTAAYAQIIAYPEVYKSHSSQSGGEHELVNDLSGVRTIAPTLSMQGKMTLVKGKVHCDLVHAGGSAAGAIWVDVPTNNTLFVGDTLFAGQHPFLADADIDRWLENLTALTQPKYNGYTVVAGRKSKRFEYLIDEIEYCMSYLTFLREQLHTLADGPVPGYAVSDVVRKLLQRYPVENNWMPLMSRRLTSGLEQMLVRTMNSKQNN